MKKTSIALLLAWLCMSPANGRMSDKSSAIVADTVINNGWVVAYGQLLKRPYIIAMRKDTIYINDIQISPLLPDPTAPSIKPLKQTELGDEFFKAALPFQTRCGELYAKWVNKYGEEKAGEMITTLLDTQQVVKVEEYKLVDGGVKIIYDYKWSDLYEGVSPVLQNAYFDMILELDSWIFASKDKRTEEEMEIEFNRHNQFVLGEIEGTLIQGGLWVVDFSQTISIGDKEADTIIKGVREIICALLPDSTKIRKISALLNIPPGSVAEFLKNGTTWEMENEK